MPPPQPPIRTDSRARATPSAHGDIRLLPLLTAIIIMLGITAWPAALSGPQGEADHWAAFALFWAMSAGFVTGVGFQPRLVLWRYLFSGPACLLGCSIALLRLAVVHGSL